MLSQSTIPNPIQAAQGQYVETCCTFTSDVSLNGKLIRVNLGMFVDITSPPPTTSALYQGIYGTNTLLTYVGVDPNAENVEVELEAIDDFNFKIYWRGFIGENYGTWLTDIGVNNATLLSNPSSANSNIGIHVDVNGDTITCLVPLQSNETCSDPVLINTTLGYCPGQDLVIAPKITGNNISNNFYFGWYREDSISNSTGLLPDTGLNYALIGTGVTQVGNIPFSCIKDGGGFTNNPGGPGPSAPAATGQVTIDGSCLLPNACYRAYVVYKQNGEWKSCISDPIKQKGNVNNIIYGDLTYCLTDVTGLEHESNGCFSGVSGCGEIKVCVKMDEASYNAALLAEGLPGSMQDNWVETNVLFGSIPVTVDAAYNETCATFNEALITGCRQIVFMHVFQMDGYRDYVYVPVEICFNEGFDDINLTILDENNNVVESDYCAEDDAILTAAIPSGATANLMVNDAIVQSNALSVSGTVLTIDTSLLEIDVCYCVKIVEQGEDNEEPCVCPPCERKTMSFILTGPPDPVIEVGLMWNGCEGTVTETISNQTVTHDTGTITLPLNQSTMNLVVNAVDPVTGCIHTGSYSGDTDTNASFFLQRVTLTQPDCDCDEEPTDCDNTASIGNINCDNETQTITFSFDSNFNSPVANDIRLVSTDGINYSPASTSYTGEDVIFIDWLIDFDDDCPPIRIIESIECLPSAQCVNQRQITCICVNSTLVLGYTDNINSPIVTDILYISIDGGVSYTEYNPLSSYTPITLNQGEEAIIYSITTFDDGCADLQTLPITCNCDQTPNPNCDYSAFALTCTESNGVFTLNKTGDESLLIVNDLQFSLDSSPLIGYTNSVTGEGLFIGEWTIQIDGCEPHVLSANCFKKKGLDICNINELVDVIVDLTDVIDLDLTALCEKLECLCDEEPPCEPCTLALSCSGDILSLNPTGAGCGTYTFIVTDANNNVLTDLGGNTYNIPNNLITIVGTSSNTTCPIINETFDKDLTPPGTNKISTVKR